MNHTLSNSFGVLVPTEVAVVTLNAATEKNNIVSAVLLQSADNGGTKTTHISEFVKIKKERERK